MAHKVITRLIDDLDGKELPEGKGQTVVFALDGVSYEIDLSLRHADNLRDVLQDYIANGRKVGRRTGTTAMRSTRSNTREIREWAQQQGMDVPARGRLPKKVMDAWDGR